MKIRLVGGPFGGRVLDHPAAGQNTIVMCGPKKKMTRKQQYDYFASQHERHGLSVSHFPPPTIEARYEIAIRAHGNSNQLVMAPCMHPDGSIFYEYVKGSKREWYVRVVKNKVVGLQYPRAD